MGNLESLVRDEVVPATGRVRPRGDHHVLDYILRRELVRAVYQPIVTLDGGAVAAYESLARGPVGSPLESPGALFGAARRSGRLKELEWACRSAALRGAVDANLGTQVSLFVNVEPGVLGGGIPPKLEQLLRVAERKLRVVLELTERDLCERPADLLRLVAWARSKWWGIALDDVGADETSMAFLPLVEPDVVKLDMELVQGPKTATGEAIVSAVRDYAARTGATVLAEGIETDEHVERSIELGATLGQGWHFGRPGDLDRPGRAAAVRLIPPPAVPRTTSVFEALAEGGDVVAADRAELDRIFGELEDHARAVPRPSLLLAGLGDVRDDPGAVGRFKPFSELMTAVIVLGITADSRSPKGVRLLPLEPRSPAARERALFVITPDAVHAVAARGPGCDPAHRASEVELVRSSDRATVVAAARLLMTSAVETAV